MATTIQTSDLTVSITESYTLNGVEYGGTINKVFSSNGEVIKRIMRIGTSSFVGIFDYETEGIQDDFKYVRITNLDDTNFISLQFFNDNSDAFWIRLKSGESFMMMDNEYEINEGIATFGSFSTMTKCAAKSNTAGCDIEILSVTA
jgi:hypothetical protein